MCRHRNPLMNGALETNPSDLYQMDLLHCFQLGPLQRWVTASLWRIILHNPCGIEGSKPDKLTVIAQRLRSLLFRWYDDNKAPQEKRLWDLQLSMLGHAGDADDSEAGAHKGCLASLKAAEAEYLVPCVIDTLNKIGANISP